MKTPKHLVLAVMQAWEEIFFHRQHADRVVERNLKSHPKWGSRDRRFFAEQVYDGVRWWKKRWAQLGVEPEPSRLILFWAIGSSFQPEWWSEFSEWPWPQNKTLEVRDELVSSANFHSFPVWFVELLSDQYGNDWAKIHRELAALNQTASVDLRVNLNKMNVRQLQLKLHQEQVEAEPIPDVYGGLTLLQRRNLQTLPSYQQGLFEIQDRASQKIAPLVNPQPGMLVVDACAGAGGKSLHLAELMKNQGQIISMDIHEYKLKELRQRAHRQGVKIIQTKLIESDKVIQDLYQKADRVLLDVPCSGAGVIRRKPDTKWKLTLEELSKLRSIQNNILDQYSRMVKPGGLLVYATCSFLRCENQDQVSAFLNRSQSRQWMLVEQMSIDPSQNLGDGFFAAVLQKLDLSHI